LRQKRSWLYDKICATKNIKGHPTYQSKTTSTTRIKIGAAGGLAGGFAVLFSVFAIDSQLGTVPGTFYKVVGLSLGLDGISATFFGMISHMLTATLIGIIFCYCSGLHPKLELTSYKKGALAGGVSAIVVYVVFFIPITLLIVQPSLEAGMQDESGLAALSNIESVKLVKNMNLVIWGALEIHIVFGIIMGIFCAMTIDKTMRETPYNVGNLLKIVIIGVVLGSAALGAYYVIISEYTPAQSTDEVNLQLDKLQKGLNYAKFVDMKDEDQDVLVKQMSYGTREIIIKKARNFGSEINEDMRLITKNLESPNDMKFIKVAKIQGLKGNEVDGKAMIVSTGKLEYLRLEDFFVTNGIGLHVYLTKAGDVNSGYDLGKLKANKGDQNYQIPTINTDEYNIVVVYSKIFDLYYASAKLQ
jgi:hypothetical protein